MSTRTEGRGSAAAEREHHRGSPWHQVARFLGLYLAAGPGLLAAWLIHLWIGGVHLHSGDWSLDQGDHALVYLILTLAVLLGAAGLIAWLAWDFAEHRKTSLRASLAGSVALLGAVFCWNVAIGPGWRAAGFLVIAAWIVATLWSIARLDVTRNDKRTDEQHEDTFLERVGLKGWKGTGKPIYDDKGERLATEVTFDHPGDTVDQLQAAVPKFESASPGSPAGFSRATSIDGRADRSKLTVMHKDPLKKPQPLPPPSSPGGSVADGLMIGTYANGQKVTVYVGGPSSRLPNSPSSPSNMVIMGMTRAGKTVAENEMMTEMGTRRDVVILYLNKSKGMQDLRPIAPVVAVAVIESDDDASSSKYRSTLDRIQGIMRYRQQQLGRFGISAWTAESCFDSPPWRNGPDEREQMEPMPLLYVHIGEADAIVSLTGDGDRATKIASKCLSLGIDLGLSLQRADHMMMPTQLRFNLGTVLCFGCSDDDSPRFVLSAPTIKAGAHPENWGQRKPGYFYVESPGVDEEMYPVAARTFSGENKDALTEQLLARNLEWASRMTGLDEGSIKATAYQDDKGKTHIWWEEMMAVTDGIRNELLGRPATMTPQPVPDDPQVADPQTDDDEEQERADMEREMRETTHVEGIELYPADENGDRAKFEDAFEPVIPAGPEGQFSWEDEKPGARDRAAAVEGAGRALLRLYERGDVKDPTDDATVIVDMGMFLEEYPFRTRPFFVALLNDWLAGDEPVPFGLAIERATDLGADKGRYRVSKLANGRNSQ